MVTKKKKPTCGQCANQAPSLDDGYSICYRKYLKVWTNSVACDDFDDSEVY